MSTEIKELKTNKNISLKRLYEVLHYSSDTGIFTWKIVSPHRKNMTKIAGSIHSSGYREIQVDGKKYRASRLAFFYVYKRWPKNQIDHINCIRSDDRIKNLRDVDSATNTQNKRTGRIDNKLGILGVVKVRDKFRAIITENGKRHHIGYFSTAEKAYAEYLKAKRLLHQGNML